MILAEDTAWDELRLSLEKRFAVWRLDHADKRARSIVEEMRRTGWRIPLPAGSEPPKLGRPLHPEVVARNVQRCRDALRAAKESV